MLVLAIIVVAILALGFGTYMQSLGNYRSLGEHRLLEDRALMAAEAGLAEETGTLENMATPPTSDVTANITLPSAQFAPFENVTVLVHPQTVSATQFWTIAATAVADSTKMRGTNFSRRVQMTLSQENFAKFELFTNNFGGVWSPGYVQFMGLGMVFMGPVNYNSGVAFFPNYWSLSPVTCYAPGGNQVYANWGSYLAGVYGNNAANNCVDILQYYDSTYGTAPTFWGNPNPSVPTIITKPTALPANLSADSVLTTGAGLTLPDNYPSYNSSAGPNFVVTLTDDGHAANGEITVQQYLGTSGGVPQLGPALTTRVQTVNGAMVVKGNITSLQGTLNGNLTIAALAPSTYPSGGNINITGNLQYQSRVKDSSFQYANPNDIVNANGTENTSYVNTVQSQLTNITDMLGIVAEGDVVIPQYDMYGNAISPNPSTPINVDGIVMATGVSTASTYGGSFAVQNPLGRPAGQINFFGGIVQNQGTSWALFSGDSVTNGLNETELWDKRASQPGSAPPFYPTTGNFQLLTPSWSTSFVANASSPVVYPPLP